MRPPQDVIESARNRMIVLGTLFYGSALAGRLGADQPMTLIRIMCEDAIHDDWKPKYVAELQDILKIFRAAQNAPYE